MCHLVYNLSAFSLSLVPTRRFYGELDLADHSSLKEFNSNSFVNFNCLFVDVQTVAKLPI